MNYKLIAMDFDETLLNDKKEIGERTKEILIKCRKKGYKIVGVTARALLSAKAMIPFEIFDYLVLNNGVNLYDVSKKKESYVGKISKQSASKMVEIVENLDCKINYIDFISSTTYYSYQKKKNSNVSFIKNINTIDEINEDIARMNLFFTDWNLIDEVCKYINKEQENVNCFVMQDSGGQEKWLVVNPKGVDKKITLENLGKKLHIKLEEMIFFGDGLNDLPIMGKVGCSVAMGNALDEIKEKADYVTLTNNEDGIAMFLEKYLKKR